MKVTMHPHDCYDKLAPDKRELADDAYTAMRRLLEDAGIQSLPNDDRAEVVVEAIAWYMLQSPSVTPLREGDDASS